MHIRLEQTLRAIDACLPNGAEPSTEQLYKMYDLSLRLQSQLLAVIYDREEFGTPAQQKQKTLAQQHSVGENGGASVTLTIHEPLPPMKRLTEAVEEHWKAMIHTAISDAARQGVLPWFEKALVEIEITTPRGTDNTRVWDTSNRAIQVILNNLKGVFFRDDDMEHMAFSVVGQWGEKGVTILRVSDFDGSRHIRGIRLDHENRENHGFSKTP